ncbi:MAG: transposase, partial [Shimia sp.]|nr:transposase [Shimia sp.]
MQDAADFFIHPTLDWQRRYEALRASFVERLPANVIADRFGYSAAYIRLLRHQFRQGKLDFSEPVPEGKTKRRRISAAIRGKIIAWRHQQLSAGDITQLLSEEGVEISVRTVERVLAEEGFSKLPRRTRLKLGHTVKGAQVPERAQAIALGDVDG